MNKELEKAYEADKERKHVRTDELQAARDYVGVLLDEAEGRNAQLEDKKQEAYELLERLSVKENEIDELLRENRSERRKNKFSRLWMIFALAELMMIVILAVVLIVKSGNQESQKTVRPGTDSQTTDQDGPVVIGEDGELVPATERYADDLREKIGTLNSSDIEPFTADITKIDGLEYLVLSAGNINVAYKNEYYPDESSYKKSVIIDNGSERYVTQMSYDLKDDLSKLVPDITTIGGDKMLVFTDYNTRVSESLPTFLRLIDCATFDSYKCNDLAEKVRGLTVVEASDERSVYEEAPMLYTLTTTKATYKYAVSEEYFNDVAYNESVIPDIESEFVFEINDDGITWHTNVKLGTELYLGGLSGALGVSGNDIVITGARFGAFVQANIEDPELEGCILPVSEVPERYFTIGGYNDERYFIAFNEDIPTHGYDLENRLNKEDPNNWIYTDENGEKLSIRGVDVSKYQGTIDWKKVANAGVEFAIIRVGFRGMNEGTLELDPMFNNNIKGALANNIKVGLYFFSQAVNEKEAKEEAEYVIKAIGNNKVEYPIIFDTERVTTFDARANNLNMETRTAMCRTFAENIAAAGYKPMIYANTKYMFMGIDLTKLTDIDKWYAVYSNNITFPYDFQMLQYTDSGSVPGIPGKVDLDISFVDYSKER